MFDMKNDHALELTAAGEIAVCPEYPQLTGKTLRLNTHPMIRATRKLNAMPVSLTPNSGAPATENTAP